MALQVIGAGFGRTGTLSLKTALEMLGFERCYHMVEVFRAHPEHIPSWAAAHAGEAVDWDALYDGYRASVDWPSCNLWRELATFYPRAKVVLTTRDPARWHESVMRTIYPTTVAYREGDDPARRAAGEWIDEIIWQGVFDGRIEDRRHAIAVYEAHVAEVVAALPAERLLVLDGRHDWPPLCDFLGCEVPEQPYPVVNSTEEFRAGGGAAASR